MGYQEDWDRLLVEFCKNYKNPHLWKKLERICEDKISRFSFSKFLSEIDIEEIKNNFFPAEILGKICPKISSINKKWVYLLKSLHNFIINYSKTRIMTLSLDEAQNFLESEDIRYFNVIFKAASSEFLKGRRLRHHRHLNMHYWERIF